MSDKSPGAEADDAVRVTVDTFIRAESDTMFARLVNRSGALGRWMHSRRPTPLENQPVIRQNRDTLYSTAVVDVSGGAELVLPDAGGRYLSVMVVTQDHHVPFVLHEPGRHRLDEQTCGTPYVLLAARVLADPRDEADLAAAAAVQDGLGIRSASSTPFAPPRYDPVSHAATREHLLALARDATGFDDAFGARGEVGPVHHLLGTAAGWGGLPRSEAVYVSGRNPGPGRYRLTLRDVPVDAFWSVTVYNGDGYMEPNPSGTVSVNSVTAVPEDDGAVVVRFGDGDASNTIPTPPHWNYTVRLYRPRAEILRGDWTVPALVPVAD